ncbi:MAG: carbamoyl phosphate synthase large subunit, partial [Candidatus Latescibacteria bacterium]|nr:carbamoyl phosphate synthase large subunit [Candidatus Latescibacterota bacterium]
IPRWTFEKFPQTDDLLGTQMKSVGETMAIGRTFKEALQKGLRSLEVGRAGFGADGKDYDITTLKREDLEHGLRVPNSQRMFFLKAAFDMGLSVDEIFDATKIDRWFLENMREIKEVETELAALME